MSNPGEPSPQAALENAASKLTSLKGSMQDLKKALDRKGVRWIRECVAKCRRLKAEVEEVAGLLDSEVVAETFRDLQEGEGMAVTLAAQYFDEKIKDVEGLLGIGRVPQGSVQNVSRTAAGTGRDTPRVRAGERGGALSQEEGSEGRQSTGEIDQNAEEAGDKRGTKSGGSSSAPTGCPNGNPRGEENQPESSSTGNATGGRTGPMGRGEGPSEPPRTPEERPNDRRSSSGAPAGRGEPQGGGTRGRGGSRTPKGMNMVRDQVKPKPLTLAPLAEPNGVEKDGSEQRQKEETCREQKAGPGPTAEILGLPAEAVAGGTGEGAEAPGPQNLCGLVERRPPMGAPGGLNEPGKL